jgi:hypothetical protein
MKKKTFLVFLFLTIFLISSVSASYNWTTETHSLNPTGSSITTDMLGIKIGAIKDVNLGIVTKWSGCTATNVTLWNYDKSILLTSATFEGDNATLDYNLTAGESYLILLDNNSNDYYERQYNDEATAPYILTNINITCGYSHPACYNNVIYNVYAVTTGEYEIPPTEVFITSVSYETPITLNGGTTKDIYIYFNVSSELVNESSAEIIVTNGAESRTSSSCTNISTEFNCTIIMQFYDSAGSWNINASIKNSSENQIENSSESFVVNSLDYITQDFTSVTWTNLNVGTDDNEADNTIILTNGGNQDYPTCNIKGYDVIGSAYADLITADKFSIDNETAKTTGQIYMQNDTNIDVSSKINLNTHSSSSTTEVYFYIDVPIGVRADNYNQINSWVVSFS